MEWSREKDGRRKRDGSTIIICNSRPQREGEERERASRDWER